MFVHFCQMVACKAEHLLPHCCTGETDRRADRQYGRQMQNDIKVHHAHLNSSPWSRARINCDTSSLSAEELWLHVMEWKHVQTQWEQKTQKSILITGPNPKAPHVFFLEPNQSSNDSIASRREESHAELQGDQKVRDMGRGTAPLWRASRQNQARRLRILADWCAWKTHSALDMPKFAVDTSPAYFLFLLHEHTLGANDPQC